MSDTTNSDANSVKKVLWTEEEDEDKWLGPAPAIEAIWDDSTGFLLQVAFTVDAKEKEWTEENQTTSTLTVRKNTKRIPSGGS